MPDNEADSTTNQHHHILSLQTNASLIRVVNSKICALYFWKKINIFIILFQIRAVTIILISSAGIGATQGFSNTAAVVYVDKNLTTLPEILNDEEISWLSIQSLWI